MPAAQSLRQLLTRSIDYAGLFPPCALDLTSALAKQADYQRSADAWMLNAFVLPAAQFNAAREQLSLFDPANPLRVSALGPKTENADAFLAALEESVTAIRKFAGSNVDLIAMNQLEMALPVDVKLEDLRIAQEMIGDLPTFWEAPAEAAQRIIALLAEHNSNTRYEAFGYKLRTGGVTPDAFPTSIQIAKALVTPATHQLPIKFTAGLHHPLRQYREEVETKMHGFLNVLGAAVLAAEHRWDPNQTAIMLEEENADSFSFTDDFFAWREWRIDTKRLQYRRRFIVSFGSCSFDEPRDDLRALNLL